MDTLSRAIVAAVLASVSGEPLAAKTITYAYGAKYPPMRMMNAGQVLAAIYNKPPADKLPAPAASRLSPEIRYADADSQVAMLPAMIAAYPTATLCLGSADETSPQVIDAAHNRPISASGRLAAGSISAATSFTYRGSGGASANRPSFGKGNATGHSYAALWPASVAGSTPSDTSSLRYQAQATSDADGQIVVQEGNSAPRQSEGEWSSPQSAQRATTNEDPGSSAEVQPPTTSGATTDQPQSSSATSEGKQCRRGKSLPCSAANQSGTGLKVTLRFTNTPVPSTSHGFIVVTDPSTGSEYATRAGPWSGPGGGSFPYITAVSGQYNSNFPDHGAETGTIMAGYLNITYAQAASYMKAFANVTNMNDLMYGFVTQNSNSYAAAVLRGMGFTPPATGRNTPGYDSNPVDPSMACH